MKWRNALTILLIMSAAATASAQNSSKGSNSAEPSQNQTYKLRAPYWSIGAGLMIWQEFLKIKRGPTNYSNMQSQFKGLTFHVDYNRTIQNSYWQHYYSLELGYGTLKGQGDQPNIEDRLDNQAWMMASLRPGFVYRTSPVSRAGIILPIMYRKIQWNFNAGSGLSSEDKPFSVGIGLLYVQKFTKDSSVNFTLSHQRMWQTAMWAAAYNYDF